jgi:hypothetical protein
LTVKKAPHRFIYKIDIRFALGFFKNNFWKMFDMNFGYLLREVLRRSLWRRRRRQRQHFRMQRILICSKLPNSSIRWTFFSSLQDIFSLLSETSQKQKEREWRERERSSIDWSEDREIHLLEERKMEDGSRWFENLDLRGDRVNSPRDPWALWQFSEHEIFLLCFLFRCF